MLSWNVRSVQAYLNDPVLKDMVLHFFEYQYNHYIAEAFRFYKDPENSLNVKWFHYSFFAGLSDKELAFNWKKSLGFVRALRLMFFDYSHWPKDRMARFSLMRQLVSNQEIDEQDFHLFRRIYDLGSLGLKSAIGLDKLTPDEARQVNTYIGASAIDNILNLRYTIKSSKDAINFHNVMNTHMNQNIRKMEVDQMNRLVDLQIQEKAKALGVNEETVNYQEDQELIDELKAQTKINFNPKFRSLSELKAEEAKITVETEGQNN
jgi:hypothetical protein